jgi:NAD(P)-dependent dehydrogenase (short-subunit alcohol dehydrogenase family)
MRVWFITGASRGFGALIAAEALAAGDAVIATARSPISVTDRIGDHPNLLAVALDVTREDQAREAVAAGLERFGRVDVLVNNAGYGLLGAVEEATGPEVEKLFTTNVFGLLGVTRAVLPQMRRQRSGHVINFSSIGGYGASVGFGVYCATKFAVEGITEALAGEVGPLGIKVTVVEPGYFRTDFLDNQSLSVSTEIADYAETVGAVRKLAASISHAQPGNPAKLATALLALVKAEEPPLRLALGSDTVALIERKNAAVAKELDAWHALSLSTDFEPTAT